MRRFVAVLALLAVVSPVGGWAQSDETLADIRQELSILYVELQRLKRELSTTGASGDVTVGGSALDRLGAIEAELPQLITFGMTDLNSIAATVALVNALFIIASLCFMWQVRHPKTDT